MRGPFKSSFLFADVLLTGGLDVKKGPVLNVILGCSYRLHVDVGLFPEFEGIC